MNIRDWRGAAPEILTPLYERGQRTWLRALRWDASRTWREVETARTTWGLPGLLAADDAGDIRGWTFFLPEDDVLHVGGLTADTPNATSALLDALVHLSEGHAPGGLSCFMFNEAPSLGRELLRHGFDVEPFLYLTREITAADAKRAEVQATPWDAGDIDQVALLLGDAYGSEAGRHFAPHGTAAEWQRYVRNLVEQGACGELNVEATRVLRSGSDIVGLVLVTSISQDTAHIAQVAVHPSHRGRGVATALLAEASAIAARQGCNASTLLVGASNAHARRLYESLGFVERAGFVAARRRVGQRRVVDKE
jgi:ribosomal protein S18 acetylase RimI-like enzyme